MYGHIIVCQYSRVFGFKFQLQVTCFVVVLCLVPRGQATPRFYVLFFYYSKSA